MTSTYHYESISYVVDDVWDPTLDVMTCIAMWEGMLHVLRSGISAVGQCLSSKYHVASRALAQRSRQAVTRLRAAVSAVM